ncbi:hypothetical protein PpBr36_02445 [Pyricularia pennisetigena]|uniref:hypothetical protein n=1 Tax=Pyricularia pennisetigena TaxID=1578925 RepID=UPI001150D2EA|nr:hypothetical protein PpBr36_02445 [Pyricularia pennisetigena]TLS30390.1 hypothetical protein PpBr36_02445 [Pyricularia pennisetigena]
MSIMTIMPQSQQPSGVPSQRQQQPQLQIQPQQQQQQQQQQQPQQPRRPHGPRLYHKKSRTGCFRCKGRRVKCDEQRPACGGCSRHMVECVYPPPAPAATEEPRRNASMSTRRVQRPRTRQHSSDGPSSGLGGRRGRDTGSGTDNPASLSPSTSNQSPQSAGHDEPQDRKPSMSHHDHPTYDQGPPSSLRLSSIVPNVDPEETLDPPESRARRLTELQLLHHYIYQQAKTFKRVLPYDRTEKDGKPSGQETFLWSYEAIEMAWESDGILYALLAHSALCKWTKAAANCRERSQNDEDYEQGPKRDPECVRWLELQSQYLSMALREQRRAVDTLSRSTADLVCMSALTILSHSFALVQTSPTRPRWQPPVEWLQMGHGAGKVFQIAKSHMQLDRMARFLTTPPHFDIKVMFTEQNMAPLLWLIERPFAPPHVEPSPSVMSTASSSLGSMEAFKTSNSNSPVRSLMEIKMAASGPSTPPEFDPEGPDTELQDEAIKVYHRVLMYIGWVERAIHAHHTADEPLFAVCRRFGAFAVWTPPAFQEFLIQRRPRALVILAYFFSLWIPFHEIWLIGSAGFDQLKAIREELPPRWRQKLDGVAEKYGVP